VGSTRVLTPCDVDFSPSGEGGVSYGRSAEQLQRALRERDEHVHALERDNFYFKQAARELRRQLKESLASAATLSPPARVGPSVDGSACGGQQRGQTADLERARLEHENEQLTNELSNLKSYLLQNPAAQMVRVKRDLALLNSADRQSLPRASTGSTPLR
jgi:hypothetical protein